ncbi:putative disease resistance RPP13-like protein 1, partial [Ananas comosus]
MAEAAAIISGFKWLAPVATEILKNGYSFIGMDVDEKLRDLQNIVIPQMEMLIEAAENSPHKDHLHGWLRSLEEAVYEAEDVLDLYDYYFLEKNIKLKNSLIKLEKTAAKAREFRPFLPGGSSNVRGSETANDSGRRVTTTSQLPHKVFGRDKQRDHIIDLLHETAGLEPESSSVKCYSIVAIVGLGGAGKTTLAQYVWDYEKEAEAKHFDIIMWVHVSQRLDVEMLTKEMVESASGKGCDLTSRDKLQEKLEFLLVLDDVWSEKETVELQLLAPLRVGNRGSKILMTTREKRAAEALRARNILDLKELEKSDFLSLFMYYAFDDAKIDDIKLCEELEEIVRQNSPKLHGSPLAARMVGSRLRRCPDGRKIRRKKLIHLWVAEGFIKIVDESERIEDIGQDYFDELLSSSFFQPTEDDDLYTIHDLLHDLAEMVSKDRYLRVEGNLTETVVHQEIRHLFLRIYTLRGLVEKIAGIGSLKQLENLRKFQGYSIHINGLENVKGKGEAPVEIKGIKLLRLEWSTADNISRSLDMDAQVLEGLRPPPHLQHLKIVGYQGCLLPSWMVGDRYLLHNLISLELSACSLPIVSKEDLAIIRSTQDVRISQVVTFMEGLVATNRSCIVSKICWYLRRGYDSQKLHNWLEKTMGIVYQNQQEEEEAQLVLPPSLCRLHIRSCPLTDSTLREGLRGLTSLGSLNLCNIVSLTSLPSADVLGCLTTLRRLEIIQCWFLTSLGGLQALGSLQNLFISFCPNLSAEGGSTSILPSSLGCLEIEACDWKHLDDSQPEPISAIDSEGSDIPFAASLQLGHLKSLWKLNITNCPNIGSLLGLQELNNLNMLTLKGCPKLTRAETKLGSLLSRWFSTDAPSLLYVLLAEEALASLRHLRIAEFKEESFKSEEEQVLQHLTSLEHLVFESCSIKSLPNNLESLSSLQQLRIIDCPNITSLPDLPRSLQRLDLQYSNPELRRRCQNPDDEVWCKISHIPRVARRNILHLVRSIKSSLYE